MNSQLSLTHLAQLTAYRIYSVGRYIPYILNQIPNAPSKILANISKTNRPKMIKFKT